MNQGKLHLNQDFVNKLTGIFIGIVSNNDIDVFLSKIDLLFSELKAGEQTEINFIRIISSLPNKNFLVKECLEHIHYLKILVLISNYSNYLTCLISNNPGLFYYINNDADLNRKYNKDNFGLIVSRSINSYHNFDSKIHLLKSIKEKEILRIATADFTQTLNLKEVTEQLSIIAYVLLSNLFRICYDEVFKNAPKSFLKNNYSIIALGKLGGYELNYSSDVDLIAFYEKDILSKGIYYRDLFTKVIQLFIETSAKMDEGFLYRIDFRLRPEGRNSLLCRSISDYFNYYESRGEDWERQMLIKSSFLTGDINLYNSFIDYLQHYIFPSSSSFSFSPVTHIKKIKRQIEDKIKNVNNIKLSKGGIRDIEFSVQVLQLLYAGKIKELRSGNTLEAVNLLCKFNIINQDEGKYITDAYVFYRKIEHLLQVENNLQTHYIPDDKTMLSKLAVYTGFQNISTFKHALENNKKSVRVFFNSVFGKELQTENNFNKIKFSDPKKASKDFLYLKEGKGLLSDKLLEKESIELFSEIEDDIINYLLKSLLPDKTLFNFAKVIKNTSLTSLWYKQFRNKNFLNDFLKVCTYSDFLINLCSENNLLRDQLLTFKVFQKINAEELASNKIDFIVFNLAINILLNLLNVPEASNLLSSAIKIKIKRFSNEYLRGKIPPDQYLIYVLGSIGNDEMSISSDVDILFLCSSKYYNKAQKIFPEFLKQIKDNLFPVKIDCRLRPEGGSSQLVWEYGKFIEYINKRARIWEFQSYIKLAFCTGNTSIHDEILKTITAAVNLLDGNMIKHEMKNMRVKLLPKMSFQDNFNIKKSNGGYLDIEFLYSYLILKNNLFSKCTGSNFHHCLSLLKKEGIDEEDLKSLQNNYKFLKKIDILLQILFNKTNRVINFKSEEFEILSGYMKKDHKDLEVIFKEVIKQNTILYSKYLNE